MGDGGFETGSSRRLQAPLCFSAPITCAQCTSSRSSLRSRSPASRVMLAATRYLRLLAAAALVAVAGVHIAVWGTRINDPMAWIADALIIACAIAIALPPLRHAVRSPQPIAA